MLNESCRNRDRNRKSIDMTQELGVGIIGVNAKRGWAREGHLPAVQALAGLNLVAVANRSQAAADAAGEAVGADRAYGSPEDLIADTDIDIVTVAVPVPAHRDLIVTALRAGKHVVTEWPIGTHTAQTKEIASIASDSGVHTAVDLQSRMNPVALRASELIASGAIGRVLRATVYSSTMGWGRQVTGRSCTPSRAHHGAISRAGGGSPRVSFHRVVADHVLLPARLADGGALMVQVVGGEPVDNTPFRMNIVGENGTVIVEGGAPRGFQTGLLTRNDGSNWPHCDGLNWPHLRPTGGRPFELYRARTGGARGNGIQGGAVRADQTGS